jgi:hypothetical protein
VQAEPMLCDDFCLDVIRNIGDLDLQPTPARVPP